MKHSIKIISFLGIAISFISSILVFYKTISFNAHFTILIIGMALWFSTAPFWGKNKSLADKES